MVQEQGDKSSSQVSQLEIRSLPAGTTAVTADKPCRQDKVFLVNKGRKNLFCSVLRGVFWGTVFPGPLGCS